MRALFSLINFIMRQLESLNSIKANIGMILLFSLLQIAVLNENVKLAATFLKRCPSCLSNLVKHLCEFTCASNQSNFLAVNKTEVAPGKFKYKSIMSSDFSFNFCYTLPIKKTSKIRPHD